MDKYVFAAIFRRDESETLGGVEEFHCSDGHLRFPWRLSGSARATRADGRENESITRSRRNSKRLGIAKLLRQTAFTEKLVSSKN
jgi:hypothetical protein